MRQLILPFLHEDSPFLIELPAATVKILVDLMAQAILTVMKEKGETGDENQFVTHK